MFLHEDRQGHGAVWIEANGGVASTLRLDAVVALFELGAGLAWIRRELLWLSDLFAFPALPRLLHGYQLFNSLLMQLQQDMQLRSDNILIEGSSQQLGILQICALHLYIEASAFLSGSPWPWSRSSSSDLQLLACFLLLLLHSLHQDLKPVR